MLHLTSNNDMSKRLCFRKKFALGFGCIGLIVFSFLLYTVVFLRDTNSVEKCLAYPYASASQLEKIDNETVADKHCVAYLSTQNEDGIQEMYLLKNKCFLRLFDVQRYVVLEHNASVMEPIGFFSSASPSDFQKEPIDWYFYSQNDLQIKTMACTFKTIGGAQCVQYFSCNSNEPFICCIPALSGNLRLESMVGCNANGEPVYTFNTGLFDSI